MLSNHLKLLSMAALFAASTAVQAANHREAPITALDHKADITDVYAFRSYDGGRDATSHADPVRRSAAGAGATARTGSRSIRTSCTRSRSTTTTTPSRTSSSSSASRPSSGCRTCSRSMPARAAESMRRPIRRRRFRRARRSFRRRSPVFASPGLGKRQSYTRDHGQGRRRPPPISGSGPFYAVPANVGPRTMDYDALFNAASTATNLPNVKVFAGTVDDPFWIDLGAPSTRSTTRRDRARRAQRRRRMRRWRTSPPTRCRATRSMPSRSKCRSSMLTRTGAVEAATSTAATIGVWGTTSRPRTTVRRAPLPAVSSGTLSPDAAHGQSADQRTAGRHRLQGPLQHGPAEERQPVRQFLPRSGAGARPQRRHCRCRRDSRRRRAPTCCRWSPTRRRSLRRARQPGPVADLLRLNTGVPPTPRPAQAGSACSAATPPASRTDAGCSTT